MDKIIIAGKSKLYGSIDIPGSKNAALPILVSSLLSKKNFKIHNIPELQDIESMIKLLKSFGVSVEKPICLFNLNSQP